MRMQHVQIQLEVSIVNVILVFMEMGFLVLVLYFQFFLSSFSFIHLFHSFYFILFYFFYSFSISPHLATLDENDQAILIDFYNSLPNKDLLAWNISKDLCGQYGISCDDSFPKRVKTLYLSFLLLFFFFFCSFSKLSIIS